MAKDKKREMPTATSATFADLAGLQELRDRLASASRQPASEQAQAKQTRASEIATPSPAPDIFARASKLVVRRERKGHGGKTVTRIEGLSGTAAELEAAARELKRVLGCGATVDGADVLVQGDQAQRLTALLQKKGARRVVQGS